MRAGAAASVIGGWNDRGIPPHKPTKSGEALAREIFRNFLARVGKARGKSFLWRKEGRGRRIVAERGRDGIVANKEMREEPGNVYNQAR